jgi:hypothetical protein
LSQEDDAVLQKRYLGKQGGGVTQLGKEKKAPFEVNQAATRHTHTQHAQHLSVALYAYTTTQCCYGCSQLFKKMEMGRKKARERERILLV